jgi:methyl-accepting chemotaxis protein
LGDSFRLNAYEDFKQTLAQTRTDNATTTRVGFALSAALILLISVASVLVIRGTMTNIRGVITSLQAIAKGDGDLTRRVNVDSNDEIGEMIQLFNGFIDKLQGTIRQIIEAASPLAGMSKELYGHTQSAKDNSRSQQGHTDSISRDIQTMTSSIQEVAHRSQQASDEQGRGFAVVADEVRNLASKTAASTAEIQNIILRLQNSANGVLSVMTANGEKAQASIERSVQATQILEAIAGAVGHINELNAGIAQYTQEQIGLSSSIQQDTQVLQQDAQATAQGAEATARLGEQLVSTGDHLRAATSQFRV